MAAPIWKIDADGTVLTLTSSPYFLKEQQLPLPDLDPQYASSVATEGDRLQSLRYRNRKITLGLRVVAASTAALQTAVNDLQAKVGKINRDAVLSGTGYGGTLQFTSVNGTVVSFDVGSATMTSDLGKAYVVRNGTEVQLDFECAPFARGAEVDLGDNTGTAPMLVFTDTAVTGDVPGLGRLVVDNDSTSDAASFVWGLRSYNYSNAATAALVWQAEALTAMNAGAVAAAGPSGSSGSGSNTIQATKLSTIYQPILKSTVGSTYWTHTGSYRVYARVYGVGTGTISVRASWALADIVNFTTNTAKDLPAKTAWCMMDLGLVRIPSGTSRWELRVQGKSSTNTSDDLYVDSILLVPVDEGYGVASITGSSLTTLAAQDTFDQSSGPNGQALSPVGGTWGTSGGSSTDFAMDTAGARVKRTTAAKDVSSPTVFNNIRDGRFLIETNAASPYAGQNAGIGTYWDTNGLTFASGVVLRYTDNSNFMAAVISHSGGYFQLIVYTVVAGGTPTVLGAHPVGYLESFSAPDKVAVVSCNTYANGYWAANMFTGGNLVNVTISGNSSVLATGGALATGKFGIVDWMTSTTSNTRYYDGFEGYQTTTDATVFAASAGTPRPLTLDNKSIVRQDSANAASSRPAQYSGDYLFIPAAGKEARTVQMAVRLGRGLIDGSGDDGTSDALSARLWVTPRYLQLPS